MLLTPKESPFRQTKGPLMQRKRSQANKRLSRADRRPFEVEVMGPFRNEMAFRRPKRAPCGLKSPLSGPYMNISSHHRCLFGRKWARLEQRGSSRADHGPPRPPLHKAFQADRGPFQAEEGIRWPEGVGQKGPSEVNTVTSLAGKRTLLDQKRALSR